MKVGQALAVSLVLVLGTYSSASHLRAAAQPPADQLAADISPEALAQIDALLAEKDARTATQRKIDSQLIYEWKMEAGQPVASGIWAVETDLPYADDGHLVVDVRARGGSGLAARLTAAGIDILFASADGSDVRAHLNIDQVEGLAADPDVRFVQPRQEASLSGQAAVPNLVAPTGQGSHSSEGDVTHFAFAARGAFHVDGSGLRRLTKSSFEASSIVSSACRRSACGVSFERRNALESRRKRAIRSHIPSVRLERH